MENKRYEEDNDIEKMFIDECREKKRTASGVYHRASRRGYIKGGVKTQVDFLRGKERKEYIKGGPIKIMNAYDKIEGIPSIKELEEMEFEVAKNIVKIARKNFSAKTLKTYWNISSYTLYKIIFKKYEIEVAQSNRNINANNKTSEKVKNSSIEEVPNKNIKTLENVGTEKYILENKVVQEEFSGFNLKFAGKFESDFISDRVLAFLSTMSEGKKYNIKFELEEINK